MSQRRTVNDPWGTPQNLGPVINGAVADHCAYVTPDGYRLIFVSNRPGGMGAGDFYTSFRRNKFDDFAWETPVNLGPTVNSTSDEFGPTGFEPDGTDALTFYFTSNRPGGVGGYDIYSAATGPDGTFLPPTLVRELSSAADDQFPTISRRDGLEIFFTSNRPGTLGNFDIWSAKRSRLSDGWSAPENLGPSINGPSNEQRAALSWFGNSIIFHSNRNGDTNLFETMRNVPAVTTITIDPPNISARGAGSFAATFAGANLTDKTYFDVRFRRPGATTEDTVLNWQQGGSMKHAAPAGIDPGVWTITGVRPHQDPDDHSGTFSPISATLTVVVIF